MNILYTGYESLTVPYVLEKRHNKLADTSKAAAVDFGKRPERTTRGRINYNIDIILIRLIDVTSR